MRKELWREQGRGEHTHLGETKGEGLSGRETLGGVGGGEVPSELVAMVTWSENCDWISLAGEMHILGLAAAAAEELRGERSGVTSTSINFIYCTCSMPDQHTGVVLWPH